MIGVALPESANVTVLSAAARMVQRALLPSFTSKELIDRLPASASASLMVAVPLTRVPLDVVAVKTIVSAGSDKGWSLTTGTRTKSVPLPVRAMFQV